MEEKKKKIKKESKIDYVKRIDAIDGWAKDIDKWITETQNHIKDLQTKLDKVAHRLGV